MNSLFDALIPRLDLQTALVLSECSKDIKRKVFESFDRIVATDNVTPLVIMFKVAKLTNKKYDTLKTFRKEIQRDSDIFMSLIADDGVLNKCYIQDAYVKYMFRDVDDIYALDLVVSKFVYLFLDTLRYDILKRIKQFIFLLNILGAYVRWVISSGNENNPSMMHMRSFYTWNVVEQQIGYFKRCILAAVPQVSEAIQGKFNHALKQNEKFFTAFIEHFRGFSTRRLYIGSKGGLYVMSEDGKRTYM
jgi:hypothetical protein